MALNRTEAASLLVLAASVVFLVACGSDEAIEERWARLDVPEPEIVFLGDFTDEEKKAITREVKSVQVSFAERFGVVTSEFTLYISTDFEALNEAYQEWLDPEWRQRGVELPSWLICNGLVWKAAIFISVETCDNESRAHGGPIAHEYFHILQDHVGLVAGTASVWPAWLIEGSAVYASAQYAEEQGRRSLAWRREASRLVWSGLGRPLPGPYDAAVSSMFTDLAFQNLVYEVGFLGVEWLVERRGEEALMEFFRLGGGRQEFRQAFDMTPDEFVEAFEEHRGKVAPPFKWQIAGVVRDPDGRPVPQVDLYVVMGVEGENILAPGGRTNGAGEFRARSPEEHHTLGVILRCPHGSRTFWSFAGEWGEKGFVGDEDGRYESDEHLAEPITGMHRRNVVIELPGTRAALLERLCQKR
ncbi:MAG: hypothetical protein F4Y54_08480 [Dehalococcoidia bacterium]|nr:hypothetical protein [Dehalococcoidia bacterium]